MKKLIIVKSSGTLPIYGGISGPIINPITLDTKDIVELINKSKEIYEVNPYNINEKIKLTRVNCTTENFKKVVPMIISIDDKKSVDTTTTEDSKEVVPEAIEKVTEKKEETSNKSVSSEPVKKDMRKVDNDFVSNSKHKK